MGQFRAWLAGSPPADRPGRRGAAPVLGTRSRFKSECQNPWLARATGRPPVPSARQHER